MSITGRFEADFQSFYDAVDKADAKLTDFQSGAGRVETSLNKMVDSLSGRKILQDATIAAEGIERIGGASKLTSDELQKMAAKASEAVAKMKAMGVEVPPGVQALANALKPVEESTNVVGEKFLELGKSIAGAFAIEKVVEFALNVGKAEQAISRLSDETQINTDDLQTLTAATSDYGLESTELAKALFNVSKGINGGDESVARGLHLAGISLEEVKDKHGKELFLDIEKGVSTLTGSLRDTAAADIFGAKLGAAMAGFSRDAQEATDKAEAFNSKLSPKEIKDLRDYADQVERLEREFGILKDKILGGVAAAINGVTDAHKNGVSWTRLAADAAKDYLSQMLGLGPGVSLANELAISEAKVAEATQNAAGAATQQAGELSKEAQAIQFLTSLRLDAAKGLEGYQVRALSELRDLGQLNQQNAAAVGVSVDQFKKYTEEVRASEAATKALTSATIDQGAQLAKIQSQITDQITKQRGTQTEIELAGIKASEDAELISLNKQTNALKASLKEQHADTKENLDKIDADSETATQKIKAQYDRLRDGVGSDWKDITSGTQAYLDDQASRALKTLLDAEGTIGITREKLEELRKKYDDAADAARGFGAASKRAQEEASAAADRHTEALKRQKEEAEKLAKINREMGNSIEYTAANFDKFVAPTGISKSGIIALLKQGFSVQNAIDVLEAQARGVAIDLSKWPIDARGPRVPGFKYGVENFSGGPAVVGEDGPELLDLPRGASVTPLGRNGAGGGGFAPRIYAPVYVSGVFDPSSSHALSSVVSGGLWQSVSAARVVRF